MTIENVRVDLGSHVVHARISGHASAPAVVLLHSLGLDAAAFDALRERLPDWRLVSFDQRGHGEAADAAVSLEAMSDDALRVADGLGLAGFHLVGHSMGGVVGGIAAHRHPDRVRSLALLAVPFKGHPAFRDRAMAAEQGHMPDQRTSTLDRWFSADAKDDNEGVRVYAQACLSRMSPSAWASLWQAMAGFEGFTALCGNWPVTMCLSALQDKSTPPATLARIAQLVGPKARHVEIAAGGHLFPLGQPEITAAALAHHWLMPAAALRVSP